MKLKVLRHQDSILRVLPITNMEGKSRDFLDKPNSNPNDFNMILIFKLF